VKDNHLYAIALAWPKDGKLLIKSLAGRESEIQEVALLGHDSELIWDVTRQGLSVDLPTTPADPFALAIRITGLNLDLLGNGN
jgi:alpha-L-fucosidase